VREAKAPETAGHAGRRAALSFVGHERDARGGVTRAERDERRPILGRRGPLGGFEELDGDGSITVPECREAQQEARGDAISESEQAPAILYRILVM
jgi:hypothetical protein